MKPKKESALAIVKALAKGVSKVPITNGDLKGYRVYCKGCPTRNHGSWIKGYAEDHDSCCLVGRARRYLKGRKS